MGGAAFRTRQTSPVSRCQACLPRDDQHGVVVEKGRVRPLQEKAPSDVGEVSLLRGAEGRRVPCRHRARTSSRHWRLFIITST